MAKARRNSGPFSYPVDFITIFFNPVAGSSGRAAAASETCVFLKSKVSGRMRFLLEDAARA
jgi:hypothetical protein